MAEHEHGHGGHHHGFMGHHHHHGFGPITCAKCGKEIPKPDFKGEKPKPGEFPKIVCPGCGEEWHPPKPKCECGGELEFVPGQKPKCKACGKEMEFGPHGGFGGHHGHHGHHHHGPHGEAPAEGQ